VTNSRIDIRRLRAEDHDQVLALAPELLTGMPTWRPRTGQVEAVTGWIRDAIDSANDPSRAGFVAAMHDAESIHYTVIGFIGVSSRRHFSGQPEAYVGELVVSPSHRRRGVARSLMDKAEQWARCHNLTRISLETGANNEIALAAYRHFGYTAETISLTKDLDS
jgi:ribosomal protein S18 acetylase RimI-like enzyme